MLASFLIFSNFLPWTLVSVFADEGIGYFGDRIDMEHYMERITWLVVGTAHTKFFHIGCCRKNMADLPLRKQHTWSGWDPFGGDQLPFLVAVLKALHFSLFSGNLIIA